MKGKGKAVEAQLPSFGHIPKKYTVEFQFPKPEAAAQPKLVPLSKMEFLPV